MWNIEDYLSTKGQDPPNNQQAKVYLFYKPSIFYTHFEHLNMLEEKQSRKLRVRVLMSRWEKVIFRKIQVRVRGRWGRIEGKWDKVWVRGGFRRIYLSSSYTYINCELLVLFAVVFAWLQRETSRNFLITRFMGEMSHVFLFAFFFTAAHFHLDGR